MKVLVTGGTGFIGYNLVKELKNQGHDVTCLIRQSSKTRWLQSLGNISFVTGDLLAFDTLIPAVQDVDWIIHLAGVVTAVSREQYFRVNHFGTRNLIRAVATHHPGIQKFIYISSLAAGGPTRIGQPRTEEMSDRPITHYGESKRAAEIALTEFQSQLPLVIIRPPVVYGPRDTGVLTFFKSIQQGWQIQFTGEDLYLSLIYVEDLVEGILALAEHDIPSGEMFYINDQYQYSMDQIQTMIAQALEVDTRKLRVPRMLLYPIAGISELVNRARKKPSYLNLQKIKEITQPAWICSSDKLTKYTGFHARYSLPDGAHRTAEWYQSHGWI